MRAWSTMKPPCFLADRIASASGVKPGAMMPSATCRGIIMITIFIIIIIIISP